MFRAQGVQRSEFYVKNVRESAALERFSNNIAQSSSIQSSSQISLHCVALQRLQCVLLSHVAFEEDTAWRASQFGVRSLFFLRVYIIARISLSWYWGRRPHAKGGDIFIVIFYMASVYSSAESSVDFCRMSLVTFGSTKYIYYPSLFRRRAGCEALCYQWFHTACDFALRSFFLDDISLRGNAKSSDTFFYLMLLVFPFHTRPLDVVCGGQSILSKEVFLRKTFSFQKYTEVFKAIQ